MSSFSQEMLRFLQPELLQPSEIIDVLIQRSVCVPVPQLRQLDQPALLDIFRNTAVPKPQRKTHDRRTSDTSKIKERIVINSRDDRHSAADIKNERRRSSTDFNEKHRVSGSDRLKPPPDFSKSRDHHSSERLKPPPDLQSTSKKIKLNRSSCETLDHSSSRDRHSRDYSSKEYSSRDHSSRDHSSRDHDSRDHNGSSTKYRSEREEYSSSSSNKTSLKRNYESSKTSDAPPRKKQPITWP